jgi:hypothetical protein
MNKSTSWLLKDSAKQLNTLVNFESALLGVEGQFSVGVNSYVSQREARNCSTANKEAALISEV